MSRFSYITEHPKKSLGALGTLMVAATLTVGSGAFFQDEASSSNNSVQAGVVDIRMAGSTDPNVDGNNCDGSNDPAGANCQVRTVGNATENGNATTIKLSNLTPGSSEIVRGFAVCNNGSVPARIRLSLDKGQGSGALFDAIDTRIDRDPGQGTAPNGFTFQNSGYQTVADTQYKPGGAFGTGGTPKDIQGEIADNVGNIDTPNRVALEPGACYHYELGVQLRETQADQSNLMGKSVDFVIRSTARSVNSQGA